MHKPDVRNSNSTL